MENSYSFPLCQDLFLYGLPGIETVFIEDNVQITINQDLLPSHCQVELIQTTLLMLEKILSFEKRGQLVQAFRLYLETTKQPLDSDLGGRIGSGIGCCVGFIAGFYGLVLGFSALPFGLATAVTVTIVLASLVGVGLIVVGTAALGLVIGLGLSQWLNSRRMTSVKSEERLKTLVNEISFSLYEQTLLIGDKVFLSDEIKNSSLSSCSSHSSLYFFPIGQKPLQSEILEDSLSIRSLP